MNRLLLGLLASSTLVPAMAFAQAAPSEFTTATRYDEDRRVTGTISPDPDGTGPLHHLAVRNSYDDAGRLTKVEKGELAAWQSEAVAPVAWSGFAIQQTAETSYDAMDRKLVELVREGAAGAISQLTQYSYDSLGRLECTAIRMSPAAFGSLPASACTPGTSGSQGGDRITRNVYDAAGQLLQVRKAVGTSLEQAYVTYSYTPNGKQEYVVDANGNKARLVYDGLDRQSQWQFPSASPPGGFNGSTPANAMASAGAVNTNDREEYGYDANGNRTSLRKRDGRTLTYTFDALNRMTSKIVPDACVSGYACTTLSAAQTRDVYYSYDLRGLQTAARFDSTSGSDAVLNGYDGFGRISSTTTAMGGVSHTLTFLHDADGNRTRITHPDNIWFASSYDGLGRLTQISPGGASAVFSATYNAYGNITKVGRGAGYTDYSYDGVGRLSGDYHVFGGSGAADNLNTAYGYNSASQIVSRTRDNGARYAYAGYKTTDRNYTPDGLNRYAAVGGNSYGYDANGNLTSDGGIGYTYDVENRLVGSSAGANLVYDPLGRLYKVSSPTTDNRFFYDGDEMVAEYDAAGVMLKRFVHGTGVDDPVVRYVGTSVSAPQYNYADYQGSIIRVADASGNIIRTNSYDEYGTPGDVNGGRFQYTGQAWIPELGMYYYKARIYSPMLGRFMQVDPIGYEDQVNLYAYVSNDPLNRSDPTGLGECPPECSFLQRTGQFLLGAAEVVTGVVAIGAGAAGDGLSAAGTVATGGAAAPVTIPTAIGSTALISTGVVIGADGFRRMGGAVFNTDPNAQDNSRVEAQRDRRAQRREDRSRGPNGNGQNRSGEGFRNREEANKGPRGERPKGPDRRNNRERNRGIDEEHSIKPKGQQRH